MRELRGDFEGAGRRFVLVVSRFNEIITERLLEAARACLLQHGVAESDIILAHVPGAWELPQAARRAARLDGVAAVIALGCVIRGETPHFDYVAGGAADGLARLAVEADIPVIFGVLTTDTAEQASARAGGATGNKGWEAALAALEMADLFARIDGVDARA